MGKCDSDECTGIAVYSAGSGGPNICEECYHAFLDGGDFTHSEFHLIQIPPNSEISGTQPTVNQQTQAKMPSFTEFEHFMLHEQLDYRTHEEIYAYFARHFGCAS